MEQNLATYLAFFALAGLTVVSALAVVTLRNLLHSALALVMTFMGVAGLYLLLQAEFIAFVQVLLYIGAVMVLILFAIMLTRRLMQQQLYQFSGKWWIAALLALLLLLLIGPVVWTTWGQRPSLAPEPVAPDATARLGEVLMTRFSLPFEIASVLLLVALVGAIVVAWPRRDRLPVVEELEQKVQQAKAGWRDPVQGASDGDKGVTA
ncbi:MAG: NADH-quinone oxidoreductase subunit J family protein [Chloroflexia bacterium]